MPAGGSEDRGPRSAAGPNQTPPGPRVPEPQTGVGTGGADRGRAWRGPGREGDENSAPLSPTPSPGMHTRPAARGPGNTPDPRAGPGLLARVAGVWGRGGFGRAVAGAPRGKVPGRIGAQGPGCAPPMPAGGSEDRGPRSAAGPNQTPPGPRVPEPRTGVGRGGADRGGPGEAQAGRATRPLRPSPQPQAQACTPDRPLMVPETLWPPCRARFSGQGCLCAGTGQFRPGCGRCAPWKAGAGWLDTAHQGEKEAQRRVFKGPWRQPPPSKIIPP
ncbi:unnamed protein product [Rangifer tarandus platyrhynchus]|uniref:Uncharacterized protein n=1 Tax=Rangifer tarandus platyrhynchus TaxID=3082113 RepID=A0ABN8Y414_RANTA|nr:unnamed protein product [Rangifer tarandus platyrhynchus]